MSFEEWQTSSQFLYHRRVFGIVSIKEFEVYVD